MQARMQRHEDGSVTLTKEQFDQLQQGYNFIHDAYQRDLLQKAQNKIPPRVLKLKCESDNASFDQSIHTITIVEEDDTTWHASDGRQYPKSAWKIVIA